jgi:hypothetical protein
VSLAHLLQCTEKSADIKSTIVPAKDRGVFRIKGRGRRAWLGRFAIAINRARARKVASLTSVGTKSLGS